MRKAVLASWLALLVGSGCAAVRGNVDNCRALSGLLGGTAGAVAGAVGVDQIGGSPDNLAIAGGGAVGFLVGGLAGYGIGYYMCEPEPSPAPPPPPPLPEPTPTPRKKIILRGVQFEFDRAEITSEAQPVLDEAARALQAEADVRISVEGHTDSIGAEAYNQRLSERRAEAVAAYLIEGGIDAGRLETVGHGELHPVADNGTPDGRAQNRRVALRVLQ